MNEERERETKFLISMRKATISFNANPEERAETMTSEPENTLRLDAPRVAADQSSWAIARVSEIRVEPTNFL